MRGRRERLVKKDNFKYLLYLSGAILLVVIATFIISFVVYNNKLKESTLLTAEKITKLVPNTTEDALDIEPAATEIGKTIEEANQELNKIEDTEEIIENVKTEEKVENKVQETSVVIEEKEPEFILPVEGETIRPFAKDNLIYSETLKEWVTHLGIDIKADRTTVVKASEAGIVTAIKNDPRYGLTIIVEHTKGFKTVYSNLLSTEFVKEDEIVEKGQSLGTVGNSGIFEISEEPHLHFEILKDNINVDPQIYI